MYHLQCNRGVKYRLLHETPEGIYRTYWNPIIPTSVPHNTPVYTSLNDSLTYWNEAVTLFSTEDLSTILQTYPELFL